MPYEPPNAPPRLLRPASSLRADGCVHRPRTAERLVAGCVDNHAGGLNEHLLDDTDRGWRDRQLVLIQAHPEGLLLFGSHRRGQRVVAPRGVRPLAAAV